MGVAVAGFTVEATIIDEATMTAEATMAAEVTKADGMVKTVAAITTVATDLGHPVIVVMAAAGHRSPRVVKVIGRHQAVMGVQMVATVRVKAGIGMGIGRRD